MAQPFVFTDAKIQKYLAAYTGSQNLNLALIPQPEVYSLIHQ